MPVPGDAAVDVEVVVADAGGQEIGLLAVGGLIGIRLDRRLDISDP